MLLDGLGDQTQWTERWARSSRAAVGLSFCLTTALPRGGSDRTSSPDALDALAAAVRPSVTSPDEAEVLVSALGTRESVLSMSQ
jgi:hypothetical protein